MILQRQKEAYLLALKVAALAFWHVHWQHEALWTLSSLFDQVVCMG